MNETITLPAEAVTVISTGTVKTTIITIAKAGAAGLGVKGALIVAIPVAVMKAIGWFTEGILPPLATKVLNSDLAAAGAAAATGFFIGGGPGAAVAGVGTYLLLKIYRMVKFFTKKAPVHIVPEPRQNQEASHPKPQGDSKEGVKVA